MAYSLLETTYGLTGSFRAGDTGPSPMYWAGNSEPGTAYVGSGSLQGWWRLDTDVSTSGNVTDSSNNSRTGTFDGVANRPAFNVRTPSSEFIQVKSNLFDGTNDSVNIGTAATWDAIIGNDTSGGSTQQMSFAAWVYKTGDGGGSLGRILDFGEDIKVYTDSSERIYFGASWNSSGVSWRTDAAFSLNTWSHIVVVYDASSVALGAKPKFYVDGVEVAEPAAFSGTVTGTFDGIDTEACYIGDRASGSRTWEGNLADVSVWNKALTLDEIKAIYQVKLTGPYKITRDFDSRGSKANPGFTGSVATFIQGYNVDSYSRFGAAISPLIGRGDVNNVFLSSSSGMMQTSASSRYFDDARKLANDIPAWPALSASIDTDPESPTYGRVTYTRIAPSPKTVTIGDDDYRIIETPGFVMEQRAFGYEREWAENAEPFAELSKWNPTRYLENQLTFMWPVVLSNPNAIDPFDFSGVIEPFEIRKRITQTGTFVGNYEDPYPNSIKAGVSAGGIVESNNRKNFLLSNFYDVKSKQSFAPYDSAQSPELTALTAFIPEWSKITSASIARLDILSGSEDASYLDVKQNLSRSLKSFRGPTYPMVTSITGTIDHYQDSFVYERFLENVYDESIYDWRRYTSTSLPYLLTSGGWSGTDPARKVQFPEINIAVYGSQSKLQGWWKFNQDLATGSADDSSGNNKHATFSAEDQRPSFASLVSPSQHIQTGSANFDKSTCAANIGSAAVWDAIIGNDTLNGSTQKMTFACWIYVDSDLIADSTYNYPRILDFGQTDIYLYFRKDYNRLVLGVDWTTQRGVWYNRANTLSLNAWHHIVVTYDATSTANDPRTYVDGIPIEVLESQAPTGTYVGVAGSDCFIANRADLARAWTGKIADLAIWNNILTQSEVEALYYAASDGPYFATASYSLNKPKTSLMGRPDFTSKSVGVGFTYATNETGIDSLAFAGLKK